MKPTIREILLCVIALIAFVGYGIWCESRIRTMSDLLDNVVVFAVSHHRHPLGQQCYPALQYELKP